MSDTIDKYMWLIKKIYSLLIDAAQTILLAVSVFVVIYIFLLRPFQVSGDSMFPNFYDKEYVLTNIIGLRFEKPKLGDVVVFKSPTNPDKDFIKRIIGVSGDEVYIKDGDLYVNSKKLDQSKFLESNVKTYGGGFIKEGQSVSVPDHSYLVMGDNRPLSSDSREWGFVKESDILGTSFFVYLPLDRIRVIKNPYN